MFKRRLIAADQASVFMEMMSDHNSSDLAPQRQMVSAENNTSGPVPQSDQASVFMAMTFEQRSSSLVLHHMMSDHNSSDLAPQRQWRLLKITLQAPFLNVQMMSDHNSSDLAPQRQEMSVENVSSGL
ncbi:hypothetical protein Tco_0063706, partial [Tanacetum coccineum]